VLVGSFSTWGERVGIGLTPLLEFVEGEGSLLVPIVIVRVEV
jgi:hypothetical protein